MMRKVENLFSQEKRVENYAYHIFTSKQTYNSTTKVKTRYKVILPPA